MVDVPCHGVEGRWPRKKSKEKRKKKGLAIVRVPVILTGGRDRNRMTAVKDFDRERPVLVTKQADGDNS